MSLNNLKAHERDVDKRRNRDRPAIMAWRNAGGQVYV